MAKVRSRGEDVREFIVKHVGKHPSDIARVTAEKFGISRQAVNKHLARLVEERALVQTGNTRSRAYALASMAPWSKTYRIEPGIAEDIVWRDDIRPLLADLPDNVRGIWNYGFTEMFNNAIDHSEGTEIAVEVRRTAESTEILIHDNGVGIFRKIQSKMNLVDERHAMLELSKGKLTTDPKRHTGQGIFFTSKLFDSFDILSGDVFYTHQFKQPADYLLDGQNATGTTIFMAISNHSSRTTRKVFNAFASDGEFAFDKTVVPVNLARYGNDQLISRSQAKRVLARVEQFKNVVFDYEGVDSIGQAFADEIYRVFRNDHPDIEIKSINTTREIVQMISRAQGGAKAE